jgi:hypothetical protein
MAASRVCKAESEAFIAMIEDNWDIGWLVAGGSSAAEMPFPLFSPVGDIEEGSALVLWLTVCQGGGYIREVALFLVGLSENL